MWRGLPAARDHLAHYPFRYIDNAFLAGLRERGVPEQDVTTLLVENPNPYFGRAGG